MIYVCFAGEVIELKKSFAVLKTLPDNEEVHVRLDTDSSFDIKVGDQGTWAGFLKGDVITVNKIELRKFLDLYYQKDLLEESSHIKIVPLVDSPFAEVYHNYFIAQELKDIQNVSPLNAVDRKEEEEEN